MRAADLLAAVFPAQAGCQDNHGGAADRAARSPARQRDDPRLPRMRSWTRPGLKALLRRLHAGEIARRSRATPSRRRRSPTRSSTPTPSPSSTTRRSRSAGPGRSAPPAPASSTLRGGDLLRTSTRARSPDRGRERCASAPRPPRDADELHDLLMRPAAARAAARVGRAVRSRIGRPRARHHGGCGGRDADRAGDAHPTSMRAAVGRRRAAAAGPRAVARRAPWTRRSSSRPRSTSRSTPTTPRSPHRPRVRAERGPDHRRRRSPGAAACRSAAGRGRARPPRARRHRPAGPLHAARVEARRRDARRRDFLSRPRRIRSSATAFQDIADASEISPRRRRRRHRAAARDRVVRAPASCTASTA
jgi:hypothetical protein